MRTFWLIAVFFIFSELASSAENADKTETSARAETDAEKLARIKRNSARAHNARRAAVPRVSAKNAGDLSVDKLNALLANAAVRNRRLGSNSAYLNRQSAASVGGARTLRTGNAAGVGLASGQSSTAVRPVSPLAPGRRLSGNGGNIVNFRNAAGVKGFGSPNPERFAAMRKNAVARASEAAPAIASGTGNAEIQKAVEAALAKRDAQSLGAKAARLGAKTVGAAKKFALALLMD